MTHTPGPERSAIYELLWYGRKHDGPWTEAIIGDQLIDEENTGLFAAAPDMLAALKRIRDYLYERGIFGYMRMEVEAAIAKAEGGTE